MGNEKSCINGAGGARLFHFDSFDLDVAGGELRMGQTRLSLQRQPFKVLALLVSKSGQIVTREEIKRQVWDTGVFVDFNGGLNFCVRQIRRALGDGARSPRFIETVHRRGYRFIAQVNSSCKDDRRDARRNVADPIFRKDVGNSIAIAVLPFHDLRWPRGQDCLADGITELIITYLSTNSSFRVVSRTSSMVYKNGAKSLARIGDELGADRVLEGAVLQSEMGIRATARLINTLTDQSEWAACYDVQMNDRLLLQEHIACAVACDAALYLSPKLKAKNGWRPRNIVTGESVVKSPGRVWPITLGNFESRDAGEAQIVLRGRLT